jgi:proline iminopeptidase
MTMNTSSFTQGPHQVYLIGTGPPIVCVHGGPGLDHSYLRDWLRPLSGWRSLLFYDQLACGDDRTPVNQITVDALVGQLIEVTESARAVGRPILMSHSWGAYLIYEAIRRARLSDLEGLVFMSPVGLTRQRFDASGERLLARVPATVLDRATVADAQGGGAELMNILAPYYCASEQVPDGLVFHDYRSLVYERVVEVLGDYDLTDLRLPSRSLIVYGDEDIEVASATAEIHSQSILRTVDHSGHFVFAEQPAAFQTLMFEFLKG